MGKDEHLQEQIQLSTLVNFLRLGYLLFMLLSLHEFQEKKITILDSMYNFYIISGEMDSNLRNIFLISCSYVFILSLTDKPNRKVT